MRCLPLAALFVVVTSAAGQSRDCDGYFTPLVPAPGFCTRILAEGIGPIRQIIVRPDGQLVAALNRAPGLVRMRDSGGAGRVHDIAYFGPGHGGSGVAWRDGWLYFAADSGVVRYRWTARDDAPDPTPEWIARNVPVGRYGLGNDMKGIAVGADGSVYVSFGSESDNCQQHDRASGSPGRYPCPELDRRAGIWRFTPPTTAGAPWSMQRFATGLRNAVAMAVDPTTDRLWAATQGRDDLDRVWGWPDSISLRQPAEMLDQVIQNADYGWPYCQGNWASSGTALIRAPDYASQSAIDCSLDTPPVMGFPAHWTPVALAVVRSTTLTLPHPGLLIAFHGSHTLAPFPDVGQGVVMVPFDRNDRPDGAFRIILSTSGPVGSLRPSGVAVGAGGTIYVSDDEHGRIYRLEPHEPAAR